VNLFLQQTTKYLTRTLYPARMSWAQLLKRVFAIDLIICPQCSGPLTILAVIEDPAVIIKILTHLELPIRAAPKAPARLDGL